MACAETSAVGASHHPPQVPTLFIWKTVGQRLSVYGRGWGTRSGGLPGRGWGGGGVVCDRLLGRPLLTGHSPSLGLSLQSH